MKFLKSAICLITALVLLLPLSLQADSPWSDPSDPPATTESTSKINPYEFDENVIAFSLSGLYLPFTIFSTIVFISS
jgi:hypothetical protein